jgi:LemA protein
MAIPFRKPTSTRRREQVRINLGPENFQKQRWFHPLKQFIAEHYKAILIITTTVACAYMNIYYYNQLIIMKQQIGNMHSQIEAGLQMRRNVVSGLTATVNRFISHEEQVFSSAIEARKESLGVSNDLKKLIESVNDLSEQQFSPESLSRLMAVAENYPQLVSSMPYNVLVAKIADVETQIYDKRVQYNDAVNIYNTRLSTFPVNIVGRMMRFRICPYFEWSDTPEWVFEGENKNVEIKKQNSGSL